MCGNLIYVAVIGHRGVNDSRHFLLKILNFNNEAKGTFACNIQILQSLYFLTMGRHEMDFTLELVKSSSQGSSQSTVCNCSFTSTDPILYVIASQTQDMIPLQFIFTLGSFIKLKSVPTKRVNIFSSY